MPLAEFIRFLSGGSQAQWKPHCVTGMWSSVGERSSSLASKVAPASMLANVPGVSSGTVWQGPASAQGRSFEAVRPLHGQGGSSGRWRVPCHPSFFGSCVNVNKNIAGEAGGPWRTARSGGDRWAGGWSRKPASVTPIAELQNGPVSTA